MTSSQKLQRIKFDEVWPVVFNTVRSVISMSRFGYTDIPTWQTSFSDIYDLCAAVPNPFSMRLYEETKVFLENHCRFMNKEIADSTPNTLSIYLEYWTEYKLGAEHLNTLYRHLNQQIVRKSCDFESENDIISDYILEPDCERIVEIGELALNCWMEIIIEPLKDQLVKLLLDQIHLDRTGECVNQTTIKSVIMSFVDVYQYRKSDILEFYQTVFEDPFLQATGEYYRKEGNHYSEKLNCIQYMKKILFLIDDEEFRSRKFLIPTSYPKVSNECLQHLVCNHFHMIKSECHELIVQEDFDALHNMYKLLKRTYIGINYMVEQLQHHISSTGVEEVQSLKEDNSATVFVETFLQIHTKYRKIIQDVFDNNSQMIVAFDKACVTIVNMKNENHRSKKAPELLAQYCDSLLRKSAKISTDGGQEVNLLNAIIIFNYLTDKDYFQRFYQKLLARRLINQQSCSIDMEEFMISKLKQMCGYEFTSNLTRMFQDIKISEDLSTKFLDYLKSKSTLRVQNSTTTSLLGLAFSVYVLQANSWPITQPSNNTFSIPQSLEKPLRLFELFYDNQHSGRKLCWMYNLSNAEIRTSHLDRPYFVTMGTYQMAILLMFNDRQQMTLDVIEEAMKLNNKELEKQILALIDNKILISSTNDLTMDSVISINFEFKTKRTKFKLVTAVPKEAVQESEIAEIAVDDSRKFYLQAVIVRIMKARKTLKHNSLIEEIIAQSKQHFTPSIPLIKKCIEILLEKQYLERSSTDQYTYIT